MSPEENKRDIATEDLGRRQTKQVHLVSKVPTFSSPGAAGSWYILKWPSNNDLGERV